MVFNDRGNTRQSPECIPKAMGTGTLAEQGEQVLTRLGGESRVTTGMAFGVKASFTVVLQSITPPTNSSG